MDRVNKSKNLVKALMSSCLEENAVFLCNPFYPVLDTKNTAGGSGGTWEMLPINTDRKKAVIQYEQYLNKYKAYYANAIPQAEILYAFKPGDIESVNQFSPYLIRDGISFNTRIYGEKPYGNLTAKDISGYKYLLSSRRLDIQMPKGVKNIILDSSADYQTVLEQIAPASNKYLKIDGNDEVVGRIMTSAGKRLLHIKHYGYDEERDSITKTGPLKISMYAPNTKRVTVVSPDSKNVMQLKLVKNGNYVTFTAPGVEYYSLVILE